MTLWTAVGAIATVAAAIATVAAAYYVKIAFSQLRFDAWLRAQEIFTGKKFTAARARLYHRFRTDGWTAPPEDTTDDVMLVCRRMTELCDIIDFIGPRRTLRHWDDPIATAWIILERVVHAERKRCTWPAKWGSFERVGKQAVKKLIREQRDPYAKIQTRGEVKVMDVP